MVIILIQCVAFDLGLTNTNSIQCFLFILKSFQTADLFPNAARKDLILKISESVVPYPWAAENTGLN